MTYQYLLGGTFIRLAHAIYNVACELLGPNFLPLMSTYNHCSKGSFSPYIFVNARAVTFILADFIGLD